MLVSSCQRLVRLTPGSGSSRCSVRARAARSPAGRRGRRRCAGSAWRCRSRPGAANTTAVSPRAAVATTPPAPVSGWPMTHVTIAARLRPSGRRPRTPSAAAPIASAATLAAYTLLPPGHERQPVAERTAAVLGPDRATRPSTIARPAWPPPPTKPTPELDDRAERRGGQPVVRLGRFAGSAVGFGAAASPCTADRSLVVVLPVLQIRS